MKITFDPAKNTKNIEERGLSFERVNELEWSNALLWRDKRRDYGEIRYCTLAKLQGRLHSVTYTVRAAGEIRVISFRRANEREKKRYEKEKA